MLKIILLAAGGAVGTLLRYTLSGYEAIVLKARELNLAGATVFRGIMGYGATSRIHSIKLLRLSEDLPVMIEIVDTEKNIHRILPFLDETVKEGLITMEKVNIIKYRHGKNL